jgi:hypothetical protein
MQIPSNMILTKVRPSLYMPFWVCVWSCISAATAGTTSFGGLVAVRFCLGIAEAPFFPGITPHPTVLDRLHLRARLQTGNTDHFSYRRFLHAVVLVQPERACIENCDSLLGSCTCDCILRALSGRNFCWIGWSEVCTAYSCTRRQLGPSLLTSCH